jgi:predicted HTH domain antitoxin
MMQLAINIPDGVFSALQKDQDEFARDLRIAAAVKWYELEQISQGRAAEIAGLS